MMNTINRESLPLGEVGGAAFSFFKAPITNTTPHSVTNLRQVYNAIKGDYYKARTQKLRSMLAPFPLQGEVPKGMGVRKFKSTHFDYCTFSGVFTTRSDKALIKHSGLLCLDFDHLPDVEQLFNRLLQDEYFEPQLLFRSPSGSGLKWVIKSPLEVTPPSGGWGVQSPSGDLGVFPAVSNYILQTYGVPVDKSCRDLSRACFLPHDTHAYLNPKLLTLNS